MDSLLCESARSCLEPSSSQQQDFPSVLIECGFVTNYTEAMALADSEHQNGIAEAIVRGAADYLGRCSYSCFGDGAASYTNSETVYTPPTETTVPAETMPPEVPSEPMTSEDVTAVPSADFSDPYDLFGLGE